MIGACVALLALPFDPDVLAPTHPIVKYASQRHRSLWVALPTDVIASDIPNSMDTLEALADADARWTKGRSETLSRSSLHLYPRDLISLESRQFSVLRQIRRLITIKPGVDGSYSLNDLPGGDAQRRALLNTIFTGTDRLYDLRAKPVARLNVVPIYNCRTPQDPRQESFSLDRLLPSDSQTAIPVIPPDLSLEVVRERSLAPLLEQLPDTSIALKPGIYSVAEALHEVYGSDKWPMRVDRRYLTRRMLVITDQPLSRRDLLLGVCRTFDLFHRKIGEVSMLAVSPQDPISFYELKRNVEVRNMVADLLEYLYAQGKIPTGVSPDHFFASESTLSDAERSLVVGLAQSGKSSKLQDNQTLASWIGDGKNLQVFPHLSICVVMANETSTINGCTVYP